MARTHWEDLNLDEVNLNEALDQTRLPLNVLVGCFDREAMRRHDWFLNLHNETCRDNELPNTLTERVFMRIRLDNCRDWHQARQILQEYDALDLEEKPFVTRMLIVRRIVSFF